MTLLDVVLDRVFIEWLQLRAQLLDPGSYLDASSLLTKFLRENFPSPDPADFPSSLPESHSTVQDDSDDPTFREDPLLYFPLDGPPTAFQVRCWKLEWLEEQEKKRIAAKSGTQVVLKPRRPGDSRRYWFLNYLDNKEKEKQRCAAEGKVYVDPVTLPRPLPVENRQGDLHLKMDNTVARYLRYRKPSNPIYKRAIARYNYYHPEMVCLKYLSLPERKALKANARRESIKRRSLHQEDVERLSVHEEVEEKSLGQEKEDVESSLTIEEEKVEEDVDRIALQLEDLEASRGKLQINDDDFLTGRPCYYRPSHPIYKLALARYHCKHPEEQYLTLADLKGRKGRGLMDCKARRESLKKRLESLRLKLDGSISSQSVKKGVAGILMAQEVVDVEEEEIVEEEEDEDWPSIEEEDYAEENFEEADDLKEDEQDDEWSFIQEEYLGEELDWSAPEEQHQEYEDEDWPSIEEEDYAEENFEEADDMKEDEQDDEWSFIQEEYLGEELDWLAPEEQHQEYEDEERPFDEEEIGQETVERPLVQEEIFSDDDVGKRKDKRWWWQPSWILNKSCFVLALLILALFSGLCIYSSSSVAYQNGGVGLSFKIHMSLPHPSRFSYDNLLSRVASSAVHMLTQRTRLPNCSIHMADCNCDGRLTPT